MSKQSGRKSSNKVDKLILYGLNMMYYTVDYPNKQFTREALTTPFICLDPKVRPQERWKARTLRHGYCSLLTFDNNEPTKCTYCLIHKPYDCKFRVSMQHLLFEKLFK